MYMYEGRSVNSANGFVILFRGMLGKHTIIADVFSHHEYSSSVPGENSSMDLN